MIYGINPVCEALKGTRRKALELFVLREASSSRLAEAIRQAQDAGVPVRQRDRQDLDRLAGHHHHQGLLLRLEPFPYISLDDLIRLWRDSGRPAFFLAVDSVTDPRNFGALARSADAAGCQGVIVPKDRVSSVTSVAEKASAGAFSYLPVCQVTNLARSLDRLKEEGVWVYGLAAEEGGPSLYETDFRSDVALVVGSEGGGLRPNVRKRCDALLAIPMEGGVSSLNASVAASVALYETVRQRLIDRGGMRKK